ncbi:unnamed protein product [Ectocarpus sp. 12 AP-2014]
MPVGSGTGTRFFIPPASFRPRPYKNVQTALCGHGSTDVFAQGTPVVKSPLQRI